jgi:UrcA family protein
MTHSTLTRSIRTLVIGLALTAVAHSAAAEQQTAVRQIEVRFGDLNLNKEAGAATLLNRLSMAARNVCDASPLGYSNLNPRNSPFACRKATMQKAVADVNHPMVTAMFQETRANMRTRLASR